MFLCRMFFVILISFFVSACCCGDNNDETIVSGDEKSVYIFSRDICPIDGDDYAAAYDEALKFHTEYADTVLTKKEAARVWKKMDFPVESSFYWWRSNGFFKTEFDHIEVESSEIFDDFVYFYFAPNYDESPLTQTMLVLTNPDPQVDLTVCNRLEMLDYGVSIDSVSDLGDEEVNNRIAINTPAGIQHFDYKSLLPADTIVLMSVANIDLDEEKEILVRIEWRRDDAWPADHLLLLDWSEQGYVQQSDYVITYD